ncbi:uncharacterized protein PHALS_12814 [Plasmopara halstedii]|uniref:Uncharacterized protein n=1 Tax=Plasmopara halstedii TaxID=4781 RepID=A0A0P1AP70_PLAHL|nr:uncharacterized protein PHALS_12814 [Plasmopara halstedii]CEG42548.1 hypothetical protein PHALS_12814 [Plasmopara halstedii]|eukprot:XP_024578917.1 hypothetical protein PHALS_12814 [Plasmopara halstedii]
MVTTTSTMFVSSTTGTGTTSSTCGSTVVMRGAGSSVDGEVNPTDYYFQSTVSNPLSSTTSDGNGELLTPRMDQKTMKQLRTGGHNNLNSSTVSATDDVSFKTLIRKRSTRMMSKARHNGDTNMQPPLKEIATGEYVLFPEEMQPVSLPPRPQQRSIMSQNRRRSRGPSKKSVKMTTIRQLNKEEPGVSFQFYGRSGVPPAPVSTLSSDVRSSCSTNDSFMNGTRSISSTRVSQFSDRVSLETNLGSLNPQSNLANAGHFIDGGFTPSIQEDEEAQALETLSGWLQASSVSTQDSFMWSR